MNVIDEMVQEIQAEAGKTRKTLERVPEDKLDWQPHTHSMSFRRLASHVAEIPGWIEPILKQTELMIEGDFKPWMAQNKAELLKKFDEGCAVAVKALRGCSEGDLTVPWSLKMGGQTVFTMPRSAVLRIMILSHTIHHRAQLGVYLRLNDIPVPAIYGPSYDEKG